MEGETENSEPATTTTSEERKLGTTETSRSVFETLDAFGSSGVLMGYSSRRPSLGEVCRLGNGFSCVPSAPHAPFAAEEPSTHPRTCEEFLGLKQRPISLPTVNGYAAGGLIAQQGSGLPMLLSIRCIPLLNHVPLPGTCVLQCNAADHEGRYAGYLLFTVERGRELHLSDALQKSRP